MSTPEKETDEQWRARMKKQGDALDRIFMEEYEKGNLVPPTKEEFEAICMEEYGVGGAELFFPNPKDQPQQEEKP